MTKSKLPLINVVNKLGFKASRSSKFPASGCIIRDFKSKHQDAFIKRGRKGDLKVRLYNKLIGETIVQYSFDTLEELKLFLDSH